MRKLMWFTVGFTAAIAAAVYLGAGIWTALLGVAAVPLFFLRSKLGRMAAVVLLGIAVGSVWFWGYGAFYLQIPEGYDGKTVTASVTVTDFSYETDYGVAADGEVLLEGRKFRVCVYLRQNTQLKPGDEIYGELRLRLTTDNALQGSTHHQGQGIFLLGYATEDSRVYPAVEVPAKYFAAKLRRNIINILDKAFPEDTLAFARALLLGDSSLLSYEEDTAFKISGIRHVIAVSGLHVSILFSLVFMIAGGRRVSTALIGIPVLLLFAAVAGFTPSVVRACIMQGLVILALLFNKEYDPPTALSFAVLVMLVVNPLTITSISFQLSVGCLVGIFLFYQRIYQYLLGRLGQPKGKSLKARLLRWLSGSVSITISAMIATTPLSAFYFGVVSLVGVLTNLMTLWVISGVFYGIMLVCAVGAVWLPAARLLAICVSVPIRYVLWMAKFMSRFPFAAVYTCSIYIVLWLIFSYLLLIVFLWSRKKRPGILLSCCMAGLVIALFVSWLEPRMDRYRVTVLDVGQGQSVLIQSDGKNYLVDCGGDTGAIAADSVSQMLLSQGVTRLDGLILTHYDKDHAGGAEPLLTRIRTDMLYLPDIPDDSGIRAVLENGYTDRISWITEDTVLSADTVTISLFPAADTAKGNESCLCVLFQRENCDILITGDRGSSGEKALIENVQLPELELLIVGHHGAASSAGMELLGVTRPVAAAISVGGNNTYGHPADAVLYRLKLFGCSVWRTDLDGTITFRG